MTRPELPPGWGIHSGANLKPLDPDRLVLTREGICYRLGTDRVELVANAWRIWRCSNLEWSTYLAHLESPKNPSAERVLTARAELHAELGYPPSLQVIGERVGMSGEGVRLVLKALGEPTSYVAERRAVRKGKQS
jgi:hypothetical protein